MITEVRMYRLKDGQAEAFLELLTTRIVPTAARQGITIHGAWLDRANNEVIWVRSYDSPDTLAAYDASPERNAYFHEAIACVESTDIRYVEPVLPVLPG